MAVEQATTSSTGGGRTGERTKRFSTGVPLSTVVFLALALLLLVIGCLVSTVFAQQTIAGVESGAVYGSLAVALVLIYRATELLNFAQGELAMATTYIAFLLTEHGFGYWSAFATTMVISFFVGVAIYGVFIRPVQHRSIVAGIIVTIGLFLLIDGIVIWIWGADIKFMPSPFPTTPHSVGGVTFTDQDIGTFGTSIAAVFLLFLLFQFTKVGLAMRASALRPVAASLVGVRVNYMLALGWGLAAILGAVAGLMTEATQFLSPIMMQPILLYSFAAAVVGGLESPAGAIVGGLIIGVILNLIGQYVNFVGSALQQPAALVVLVAVLLVRPAGLFGRPTVRRV
jgi:branched-chain amino acid transport system permease protein